MTDSVSVSNNVVGSKGWGPPGGPVDVVVVGGGGGGTTGGNDIGGGNGVGVELVGAPCGQHGSYTFYKAFKYRTREGRSRIVALGEFFFAKIWTDSDLVCIGELQLLWEDRSSCQVLTSLRLYFLPENTPEGRNDAHGEDEVVAISEKVVLKVEDVLMWMTEDVKWQRGLCALWEKECLSPVPDGAPEELTNTDWTDGFPLCGGFLDLRDVQKEKQLLGYDNSGDASSVIVLSYARYCRYRALQKRLEGVANKWLRYTLVVALGGFAVTQPRTRVLFCRETFDYPELEDHELLCNHLAPKLKGRPRKKRKKRSLSPGSESNESESSSSTSSSLVISKPAVLRRNGLCRNYQLSDSKPKGKPSKEEVEFLEKLNIFMNQRNTPIERVPHLGFKKIDLFFFFDKVQILGGYEAVTAKKMWKHIYDELGGHPGNTSAATCTRRHFERLLLPFERHSKGEEHKPLPPTYKRRPKCKLSEGDDTSTGDQDVGEGKLVDGERRSSKDADEDDTMSDDTKGTKEEPKVAESPPVTCSSSSSSSTSSSLSHLPPVIQLPLPMHPQSRPPDLKLQDLMAASAPPPSLTGQSALHDLAKIASRIDCVAPKIEPPVKRARSSLSMSAIETSRHHNHGRRPSVIQHTHKNHRHQEVPTSTVAANAHSNNLLQCWMTTAGSKMAPSSAFRTPVQSLSPFVQTGTVYTDPLADCRKELAPVPVAPVPLYTSAIDLSVKSSPGARKEVQEKELDLSVRKEVRRHSVASVPGSSNVLGMLKSAGIRLTPSVEIKPVQTVREPLFPEYRKEVRNAVTARAAPIVRPTPAPPPAPPQAPQTTEPFGNGKASVTISITTPPATPVAKPPVSPSVTIEPRGTPGAPQTQHSAPATPPIPPSIGGLVPSFYMPYMGYMQKSGMVAAPQQGYPPHMWDPASYYSPFYTHQWFAAAAAAASNTPVTTSGGSFAPPQLQMPLLPPPQHHPQPTHHADHLSVYKELLQRGLVSGAGFPYVPGAAQPHVGYPPAGVPTSK